MRRAVAWAIAIAAAAGIAWAVDRQTMAAIRAVNDSAIDTLRILQGRPYSAPVDVAGVDVDPDPPAIATWRGYGLELAAAAARYLAARARRP